MTKALLLAAAGALSMFSGATSAQNFNGASIRYQYLFLNMTTATTTQTATVGPQVEFTDTAHGIRVDLSGSVFTVTDLDGGGFAGRPFNGFSLSDVTNNLAAITGVSFASGGFAGERPTLTFDANNIFLNFANITQSTAVNTAYRYNVTFAAPTAAVPEPATWGMMVLGFGAMGFAMRRRVRTSEVRFNAKIKQISEGAAA